MIRSHYLPAAYIGRFSSSRKGRLRERHVWTLRKDSSRAVRLRADNLARVRGLYAASLSPGLDLESNWETYERRLPEVLDVLASGRSLPGRLWLHVLVPFVAGSLVRGPEFDQRHLERLGGSLPEGLQQSPNDAGARSLELQRLLAAVMVCEWNVLSSPGQEIACNDLGRTAFLHPQQGRGLALPLGPRHVLALTVARQRPILRWNGSEWQTVLQYGVMDGSAARDFNRSVAQYAQGFVFGRSEDTVNAAMPYLAAGVPEPFEPMAVLGFSGRLLIVHEWDWWIAATALHRTPQQLGDDEIDWDVGAVVSEGMWSPPAVWIPANLPRFPPGISRAGDDLLLTFHEVQGFSAPPYLDEFGGPGGRAP